MIIQNTSGKRIYLGFYNQGLWLDPNQTYPVDTSIVESNSFKMLENSGKITIVFYDPDFTRYVVRQEIQGNGGGTGDGATGPTEEITRTSGIHFTPEYVTPGNSFVYKLDPIPSQPSEVIMYLDTQRMNSTDFNILVDGTIEWLITAEFPVEVDDEVSFRYTAVPPTP